MKRICIFCGARPGNDDYLALARAVGTAIVGAGYGVAYGGGRVGLMGALADGALAAGGEVVGVIPEALSGEEIAHRGITALHVVGSMHGRKALLEQLSDAFIALPGGIGTMDEFCEMLTWRQLGIHRKPVALLNHNGFYDRLIALFDDMVVQGFVPASTRAQLITERTIEATLAAFI